jgi:hypothetical protein
MGAASLKTLNYYSPPGYTSNGDEKSGAKALTAILIHAKRGYEGPRARDPRIALPARRRSLSAAFAGTAERRYAFSTMSPTCIACRLIDRPNELMPHSLQG